MILGAIKEKTREAYSRILLNRTTAAFFIFSFVLCLAQGIIQSFLFSIDSEYKGLIYDVIATVDNGTLANVTYIPGAITTQSFVLRLCDDTPVFAKTVEKNCTVVFDTAQPLINRDPMVVMEKVRSTADGQFIVVGKDTSVTASVGPMCAKTLLYAYQNLRNSSSEDLTLVLLEFWLLGISVLAVANDSVAHLLTVLAARALVTGWSMYTLWRTHYYYRNIFQKLYAEAGTPCQIDFFSAYFPQRTAYEIPNLVLNITGLLIACWLSWRLLRAYNAQAMRYVGAPEHINSLNKLFLAVLCCLQLEIFVLVTAMGLWIDVLFNTAIRTISSHTAVYMGGFIATSIALIPWICLGWYGIRREMKKTIALFFLIAFVIIVGWSIMFYSQVYRWSFVQWPFLGCFSAASYILIISSTILAIICRLNFDKGLKQYLEAEAVLAKSGFSPEVFRHDEEKNTPLDLNTHDDFKQSTFSPVSPKYEQPMPTYIASLPKSNRPEEHRAPAQGVELRVPRLNGRPISSQGPPAYTVRFGESF